MSYRDAAGNPISADPQAEIARLRAALEWYADEANWERDAEDGGHGLTILGASRATEDAGERAKAALAASPDPGMVVVERADLDLVLNNHRSYPNVSKAADRLRAILERG